MSSPAVLALVRSSRERRSSARFRALRRGRAYLEVVDFRRPPYARLGEYREISEVPDAVLELFLSDFLSDWLPFLCVVEEVLEAGDDVAVGDPVGPDVDAAVDVLPVSAPPVSPPSSSDSPSFVPLPPGPCRRRWGSLVLFPYADAVAAVANVQAGLVPPPHTTRSRSRRRRRR